MFSINNNYFLLGLFLSFVLIFSLSNLEHVTAATPLYVNGTSGDDDKYDGTSPTVDSDKIGPKKTIQRALDEVDDDGAVNVAEGTYQESLRIDRNVELKGSGSDKTELIPVDTADNVITINPTVTKAIISGFTIKGSSNAGIINEAKGITIENNDITENRQGIVAAEKSETCIEANNIINNDVGVLSDSESTRLRFNRIYHNSDSVISNLKIDAEYNWWGSNNAPEIINVDNSHWIYMTFIQDPTIILNGGTSTLTANFNNEYYDGVVTSFDPITLGHLKEGILVTFTTDLGSVGSDTIDKPLVNGVATAILTSDEGLGMATVSAKLDQEILENTVGITNILYVNINTGNDLNSGTSPTLISGTTGPLKTIQAAINKINVGGTIIIAPGTYNEHLIINKNLSLNGTDRITTIINGTHSGRIISITGTPTVNINHLFLLNGFDDDGLGGGSGGAISLGTDATVYIVDSLLVGNSAGMYGGAIANGHGSVFIIDSTLSSNFANRGGAIDNYGGSVSIVNSTFSGNHAYEGGVIYNSGPLFIERSSFSNNYANSIGGVIFNYNAAVLAIVNSLLDHNSAANMGGSIYLQGGTVSISNSTLRSNFALKGGAIYNYNGTVTIFNSSNLTFNNATSPNDQGGAALFNNKGTVNIDGSNLDHNHASYEGGALYNYDNSLVTITNSVLESNSAIAHGGAIFNDASFTTEYSTIHISNSSLSDNTASSGSAIVNNFEKAKFNISNSTIARNIASLMGALYNYKGELNVHFNYIINNTPSSIYNNAGTVDATYNWWGNNTDPSGNLVGVGTITQWLVLMSNVNPAIIPGGSTTIITVDLLHDSGVLNDPNHPDLYYHDAINGHVPDGLKASFTTTLGTLINVLQILVNGTAQTTLNGGTTSGVADVMSTVDSESVHSFVTIDNTNPNAWTDVKSGLYNVNKFVSLFISETGTIYYTRNGANPNTLSSKYTGPLLITATSVLKFLVVDSVGNSAIYTVKYTIDKIAPKIISTTPKNRAKKVSRIVTIALKFNEKIKVSNYWSKIVLKNKKGKKIAVKKWIRGNVIYIKARKKLLGNAYFTVTIPKFAVKDIAGNNLLLKRTFKFKTKK